MIVQLVQINQPLLQRNYLPYAAGLLQAYVLRHAIDSTKFTFMPTIFERDPIAEVLPQTRLADIVAFSCYVWNINYALSLAQEIKKNRPETLIIMGGPQIPDQAESFLRKHPWVNWVCQGEGEVAFLEMLEAWPDSPEGIAGVSWIDLEGQFQSLAPRQRLRDLDQIPSPYLLGLFEPILKKRPGTQWSALWETNRGCPFSCAYCDWGSAIAAKVNRFGLERLTQEIEWFGKNKINQIFCCDANFGMLPRDLEITDRIVTINKEHHAPLEFNIQNTKNMTERAYQIQTQLAQSGLNRAVTLSLQSVNPVVLKNILRDNISLESYRELQLRFRNDQVRTYTDILIALPGETFKSFCEGINQVIEEGQHHQIRFYNVFLLPNAAMAQPQYRKEHGIKTVQTLCIEPLGPVESEIAESIEMVISTDTLSVSDWSLCREIVWWSVFIYFNRKLLQIPIVLIRQFANISYTDIFLFFMRANFQAQPLLQDIQSFIKNKSVRIQSGEAEFCPAPFKGQLSWMAVEDFLTAGLQESGAWQQFFSEVQTAFENLLAQNHKSLPTNILKDSLLLSKKIQQAVLDDQHFRLTVNSNLWEVYQGALLEKNVPLQNGPRDLVRDWRGLPYDHVVSVYNTSN